MPLAETVAPTSCASDCESVAMAATNGPSSLLNRTNFQRGSISSVMMSETMPRIETRRLSNAASESCGAVAETGVVATPSLLVSAESKNACCQLYSSTLMWPTSRETEPTTRDSRPEDLTYALPVSSAIA